ncbi:UDP-N-acetyl-D-mannosamine dehydrogenase [Corynebacterium sp. 13CS0277]|uniref:UDP-N-acetyl-D-mannosamine dehydrogenase n=1 Tax=Corynebacterium sp. 13CS0277 TaxID=2071994 RepID=UPI000D040BCB|nr:UDP-N-acetyl-D-mannosamine dehydrogenase [Corynebacterium sp. 13CS0277]PRQ10343.1 UDP-N-acetyl-D-mannosamine dehydrogenase [Corynebacterium sp. 13CS0277]
MSGETSVITPADVCVVGLGYIGLPTAAFFANAGLRVIGVDVNAAAVDSVNKGTVPFHEPNFAEFLAAAVESGRLTAQTTTPSADVYILAVPTPFRGDYEADLSYIDAASRSLAPLLRGNELIVLESTSPPKTTEHVAEVIFEARPDLRDANSVMFAHCPERVLPGKIMEEMRNNARVVGGLTPEATTRAAKLYANFCEGEILQTDATTAELAKLTENSFRDVNIAFANELSMISEELGVDVWELIELANHHPRVNILQPGPGVGGHCIAVDPWFIVASAPQTARLIRTAREVNNSKPDFVLDKVRAVLANKPTASIAALGLSFKADIDDLRESPAVDIVASLADMAPEATILAVEPHISALPKRLDLANVKLTDLSDAVQRADVVLLLVDHAEFKSLTLGQLAHATIVDTKGLWRA